MSRTIVIGRGGHARVIADILVACERDFLLIEEASVLHAFKPERRDILIIGVGDNATRERISNTFASFSFGRAIHPNAVIGSNVEVGVGTVVMPGVIIGAGTRIGAHVIVNNSSSIDHDCVIEDYASIAPGVTIGGSVKIGSGTAVCIGATVVHSCAIGDQTVIGAGAVVTGSLPSTSLCFGVPAKVIRQRDHWDKYL